MRKRRKDPPSSPHGLRRTRRYFSLVSLVWILSISFFCWFSRFSRALRSSMKVASPSIMFIWSHRASFSGDGVSPGILPGPKVSGHFPVFLLLDCGRKLAVHVGSPSPLGAPVPLWCRASWLTHTTAFFP